MYCWECPHYIMGCTVFDNINDCKAREDFIYDVNYHNDNFFDIDDDYIGNVSSTFIGPCLIDDTLDDEEVD